MKIKTFEEMKKYKVSEVRLKSALNTFNNLILNDDIMLLGNVDNNSCKPGMSHTSNGGTLFYTDINSSTHTKARYCGNGCGHYYIGAKENHSYSGSGSSKDNGNGTHTWTSGPCVCGRKTTNTAAHSSKVPIECGSSGTCQYCGARMTKAHDWSGEGYEGTHYSGKGHRAYKICKNCQKTAYYSPDKYIQNLSWDGYNYTSTHTNGKGHLKIGKCQLKKSGGGICGVQENIPNDYYTKWSTTVKWFPYDNYKCVKGYKCNANNCSFPANGGKYNKEGYDDYKVETSNHDMDTNKVCKRCGWSDKPPQWSWTTSELNAFRGVSGYDVTDLTYTRWNKFVEHVTMVVNWYYGSGSKPSLSGASMSSSDKVLTASRFNTVRSAIGGMNATGIDTVYSGNTVYGSYFITLADRLNNVKK